MSKMSKNAEKNLTRAVRAHTMRAYEFRSDRLGRVRNPLFFYRAEREYT